MKILVTGGSGMVGRDLKEFLPNAYFPTRSELDLENPIMVKDYMMEHRFDYVIHLAAYVGSLHDNIFNSTLYFDKNVMMNTIITKSSYESGVMNFLGILSTCIYPDNLSSFPIGIESLHDGKPHKDLMSYAYAKRSHAVQIDEYKKAFRVNYNYLIPCNMYGDIQHEGRAHFINDLVYKIKQAKDKGENQITLFGDGTPLRQFMYSKDFAKLIKLYVENNISSSMNVAPNSNLSVSEMAKIALKVLDCSEFKINYDASLPNGQHRKDVSYLEVKEHFSDFKFTSLEDGIKKIYSKI